MGSVWCLVVVEEPVYLHSMGSAWGLVVVEEPVDLHSMSLSCVMCFHSQLCRKWKAGCFLWI